MRLAWLVLVGTVGVAAAQAPAAGKAWPVTTPQAVGLDAKALESLDADIASGKFGNVDSMLVMRHGKVAYDKTYTHNYAPPSMASRRRRRGR